MSVLKTIIGKEFSGYFKSYTACIVLGIYLLLSLIAVFYSAYFFEYNNRGLISFFIYQPEILNILLPAVTMKMWAEERRYGTLEFLLTQPVSYTVLVWGKFLAAWLFALLMLASVLPFVGYAASLVEIDWGNLLSAFIGQSLVMGALCALGCFISACSGNVIVAYLSTVFAGWLWENINFDFIFIPLKENIPLMVHRLNGILNFREHYQMLVQGQLGTETVIYFGSMILFALWLNIIVIQGRRD